MINKILNFYSLTVLAVLFSVSMQAQPLRESTYEDKLEYAKYLEEETRFYNALDMYEECFEESKDNLLVKDIARMNIKLRDYERAAKWYGRMMKKPEKYGTDLQDTLALGRLAKYVGEHASGKDLLNQYIALSNNDSLVEIAREELKTLNLIGSSEIKKNFFVDPVGKPVNKGLSEQSPTTNTDGYFYFSTFNKSGKITIEKGSEDNNHINIFRAKMGDDGSLEKGKRLSRKINRDDFHTGNVSFSDDGRYMFFTRSRLVGDSLTEGTIYMSELEEEEWTGAVQVEGINGDYVNRHPKMGELFGDKVMFFTSNMPGGYGSYDIYYATWKGGSEFSAPVNLGPQINAGTEEMTPWYDMGYLYFSSDRTGFGGYDIYQSAWNGSTWGTVTNLGKPINSEFDDFYFSWDDENQKGYMVSNRSYEGKKSAKNETCCDDIFQVTKQDLAINALVTLLDEDDEPINGGKLIVQEYKRGVPTTVNGVSSEETNILDAPLKVDKEYLIIIEHDDYHPDSFIVNTVGLLEPKTFTETFNLKAKPDEEPDVRIVTINEAIRLNNIYYDFDDDKILDEAEADLYVLKGLLDKYPTMVIELSSHTDARGNKDYNQGLSQRRAESAKKWLVRKGIKNTRIKAVGYGEQQILNKCQNGVDCTEQEHRYNRRTEFKIIAGPQTIEIRKEVPVLEPNGSKKRSHINHPKGGKYEMFDFEESGRKSSKLRMTRRFHDFGIVHSGDILKCDFEFQNTGDAILVFESITSEKFVTFEYPKYPISPGETGVITTTYDSANREGEDEIALNIVANTATVAHTARIRAFVQ